MFIPDSIVVHCSATTDHFERVSWDDIYRFHVQELGWQDIGYHYGIEYAGGFPVLLEGRPWHTMGAHCRAGGMNKRSLGLCVTGNFDLAEPEIELWDVTIAVLRTLCVAFNIPTASVYGHREFESNKSCPGSKWDLDGMRRAIAGGFVVPNGWERALILKR